MKKVFGLLLALLLLNACDGDRFRPAFELQTGLLLQERGKTIFRYDPGSCQTAFNSQRCEFRVHSDNMSDFYSVRLSRIPSSTGEKVTGQIRWTTDRDLVTKKNITLEAVKLEGDTIWLWSSGERIGVTVRLLD